VRKTSTLAQNAVSKLNIETCLAPFTGTCLTEKYERVFPSLEGLTHLARCCNQSVVTALDDLERLGFVTRIRRTRPVQTPLGFRVVQITNAYRVHEPTSGLGLLASVLFGKASESNYSTPSEGNFHPKNEDDKNTASQRTLRSTCISHAQPSG
jgi:hypothetical protein